MNKDETICEEIVKFVKANGPIVRCIVETETLTLKFEVLKDINGNVKLTRRTK